MTEKHKKVFVRILIVTAIVWVLGVLLLDISLPELAGEKAVMRQHDGGIVAAFGCRFS